MHKSVLLARIIPPEGQKNVHIWRQSKFNEEINCFKKQDWSYCQSKNFSGTSDTVRHLKIFEIISNEMSISLLILCL